MAQKKILFVCTGDHCRTILARVVALKNDIPDLKFCFETASCTTRSNAFTAESKVHPVVLNLIKKRYGERSEEYRLIKEYTPRPLSKEIVSKMDRVYFLCETCMQEAKSLIPEQYHERMRFYCTYKSRNTGRDCHEVPNPLNDEGWVDYYGKGQQRTMDTELDCGKVLDTIINDLMPALQNDLSKW